MIAQLQDAYEKTLAQDHFDIEANFNLATIFMQTKEYDKALLHYKNCV